MSRKQFAYFDKVKQGTKQYKKFPTITAWATNDVKKRITQERKSGGFEKGKVIEKKIQKAKKSK